MSEDRQPQPHDRVEVTFETEFISEYKGRYAIQLADGMRIGLPVGASVRVLEPADDPRQDSDGTARRFPNDGMVFVAREGAETGFRWASMAAGQGTRSDAEMVGAEVIGAVPGTPAAEEQRGHGAYEGGPLRPGRLVGGGKPEPPLSPEQWASLRQSIEKAEDDRQTPPLSEYSQHLRHKPPVDGCSLCPQEQAQS